MRKFLSRYGPKIGVTALAVLGFALVVPNLFYHA